MTSSSGITRGWSVEARYVLDRPKEVDGILLDKEWRPVSFSKSSRVGVPRGSGFHLPLLTMTGLFGHEAAQALRWWFVANAEREFFGSIGLETRLVAHDITYSFEVARVVDGWDVTDEMRREVSATVAAAKEETPTPTPEP